MNIAAIDDRLVFNGFTDLVAVERYLLRLREAAWADDRATLVDSVQYPLRVNVSAEQPLYYRDKAELLADYDSVFTEKVLATLRDADYAELFVNYRGAMLGRGEVWMAPLDGGGMRIFAINP